MRAPNDTEVSGAAPARRTRLRPKPCKAPHPLRRVGVLSVLDPAVSESSRRSVAALDSHVLGRPPRIWGRLERRVRSNLLKVFHTTSNAGVDFFLIDTATTSGKREQCTCPTHEALEKHHELTKLRCLTTQGSGGAGPGRKPSIQPKTCPAPHPLQPIVRPRRTPCSRYPWSRETSVSERPNPARNRHTSIARGFCPPETNQSSSCLRWLRSGSFDFLR